MGAFGDYFGQALQGIGSLRLAQQQQQAALSAYTASGTDWVTGTTVVNIGNVDFNNMYALRQPVKIAPRDKESAVEWLDRRVSEICVKL